MSNLVNKITTFNVSPSFSPLFFDSILAENVIFAANRDLNLYFWKDVYWSIVTIFTPLVNGFFNRNGRKARRDLSNNDGCVIARSNEAKALGIPMGAPAFQYKDIFAREKIKVFSSTTPLWRHE